VHFGRKSYLICSVVGRAILSVIIDLVVRRGTLERDLMNDRPPVGSQGSCRPFCPESIVSGNPFCNEIHALIRWAPSKDWMGIPADISV
jgi:hypothetical protein